MVVMPTNQALQLTQKASFVLCIALRSFLHKTKATFWASELGVSHLGLVK
jgi:hypothetical protein